MSDRFSQVCDILLFYLPSLNVTGMVYVKLTVKSGKVNKWAFIFMLSDVGK